jgi:hypothetical protein
MFRGLNTIVVWNPSTEAACCRSPSRGQRLSHDGVERVHQTCRSVRCAQRSSWLDSTCAYTPSDSWQCLSDCRPAPHPFLRNGPSPKLVCLDSCEPPLTRILHLLFNNNTIYPLSRCLVWNNNYKNVGGPRTLNPQWYNAKRWGLS